MLIIFGIGIFGNSLSAVEARFHMLYIIQWLCFICISRSNGLVTVEVKMSQRDGIGAAEDYLATVASRSRASISASDSAIPLAAVR